MTLMLSLFATFLMTLQAPAPVRTIDRGLDSQVDTARQATVRTAAEWDALWRLHGGERARPAVDFGKEMVVAVFMGSRPTAGFSVEIVGTGSTGPPSSFSIVKGGRARMPSSPRS